MTFADYLTDNTFICQSKESNELIFSMKEEDSLINITFNSTRKISITKSLHKKAYSKVFRQILNEDAIRLLYSNNLIGFSPKFTKDYLIISTSIKNKNGLLDDIHFLFSNVESIKVEKKTENISDR